MQPFASTDPRHLGDYRLDGVLGRGGQGTVYLGQNSAGAKVAVKVINAQAVDDQNARRRFTREAEAAGRVAGFCTARVLDAGIADGRPYLVSEFIAGPSLDRLVQQDGVRSGSGLERLAVATLTALAAIHRAGIVHRDFKPSNVIMGAEGPVVIDFGIARTLDQTVTSTVIGTPAFMAPEQFDGGAIGPEADLFSWAGTMVFAATGRSAFTGNTTPALMRAILDAEPELTGVPAALRPVLERCLAKDPRQRPAAEEVLRWLTGAQSPFANGAQATARMVNHSPIFEPPPTRRLEENAARIEVRTTDPGRRPSAPLAIVAAVTMTVGALLGFTAMALQSETLGNASFGGLFLSVLLLGAAVWRFDPVARIVLCSTIPFTLVYVYWAVSGLGWGFPEVLLVVVPVAAASLSIMLAAILLRRVGAATVALGIAAGALTGVYAAANLALAVLTIYLNDGLFLLFRATDVISSLLSCAWFIVLSVALVRHARAQA